MTTIKAKQLLPYLRELSSVNGIPGNTLEKDGIEEYVIPQNEIWTFDGEHIESITVEIDIGQIPRAWMIIHTIKDTYLFIDEDIDLERLKRYQTKPLSFTTKYTVDFPPN